MHIYQGPTCIDLILHPCRNKLLSEAQEAHVNKISPANPDNDLSITASQLASTPRLQRSKRRIDKLRQRQTPKFTTPKKKTKHKHNRNNGPTPQPRHRNPRRLQQQLHQRAAHLGRIRRPTAMKASLRRHHRPLQSPGRRRRDGGQQHPDLQHACCAEERPVLCLGLCYEDCCEFNYLPPIGFCLDGVHFVRWAEPQPQP
jgi:hypothetical protein